MVYDSHTFERKGLSPRKAPWHCKYNIYIVAIAILMDQNKVLLICIALFYQLDLVLKLIFVSDSILRRKSFVSIDVFS